MNRQMTCGTSSISFQNPVFIQSCASVVSRKEGEGPLGAYFDTICEDPMFGTDTWEAAESTLQKQAALLAIKKNGLTCSDIQLLFAGDLLAQTSASSFGTAQLHHAGICHAGLLQPECQLERLCAPQHHGGSALPGICRRKLDRLDELWQVGTGLPPLQLQFPE